MVTATVAGIAFVLGVIFGEDIKGFLAWAISGLADLIVALLCGLGACWAFWYLVIR